MIARLKIALSDLRALGTTAPMRAATEASKVGGGHALLFRPYAFTTRPSELNQVFRTPPTMPAQVRGRIVAELDGLLSGVVPIFGRPVALGQDWNLSPDNGSPWEPGPWWKIDIRSSKRSGDVKWSWELGRHRHLLVLARAVLLGESESAATQLLESEMRSWLTQNPVEQGVHWYSNLEIALRALVWLQILDTVGERLAADVRQEMSAHLLRSGYHLLADLPYTVSSMRNNHMLGDALGLMALGKAFGKDRWWRIGNRLFNAQLGRHMRSDGSMIEDSLSYHRFVTEMLAVRVLLGDAPEPVAGALRQSGEQLTKLGVFAGPVPQFGDWDEGRVLGSSGNPLDVAGAAALALSLSGTGATAQWRQDYDECAWYAAEGAPAGAPMPAADGRATGGGFARAEVQDWTAWLKAGGGSSHQHADLCSTVLRIGPRWVVGDPGTGTYNGPLEQRNAFRTSSAHSVLRIAGEDQFVPHRAFRWLHKAEGVVGPPPVLDGVVAMWGVHSAYRRLPGGGRVTRLVIVAEGSMTVCDLAEGPAGRRWDLTLPLHPDVRDDGLRLKLPDGPALELDLPTAPSRVRGQDQPYAGWWSHTYGSAVPTTWLQMTGQTGGAVTWGVREIGARSPERLPDGVRLGELELRLSYTRDAAVLTVSRRAATEQVLWARLAA